MKHVEYSWTTFDDIKIFAQSWAPDAVPKAVIALVHGLGEHSDRYTWLVKKLPEAGYALNAYDLRGHGRSAGPRVHAPSFEALMRDIDRHLENTRERFPGLPVFLYGHSLGGEQVLYYALRRSPSLAGVIATSPLLALGTPVSPAKVAIVKLLARVMPTIVTTAKIPWESLSRDSALVELTKKDPLYQEGASMRMAAEFLDAGQWISSQTTFPLPLLLMQGTDDRHVDPKKTIELAQKLAGDVTFKLWDAGRHELHNDLIKDEVVDFAISWVGEHAQRASRVR